VANLGGTTFLYAKMRSCLVLWSGSFGCFADSWTASFWNGPNHVEKQQQQRGRALALLLFSTT
jgi:hypothetical protein